MINHQLPDKYTILSQIGSGGMGIVLKAKDEHLDKTVAIKLLNSSLIELTPIHLQRFQTEAKTAGKLNHENLVTVMDFGVSSDNIPYLVMEYIEGTTLKELLEPKKELPLPVTLTIVDQIAQGMIHAHSKGVIHRDLKPANILIVENSQGGNLVKIVDFGIAKTITDEEQIQFLTQTGELVGTPAYMSPEQISGAETSSLSDVYSLGCILFECLTGKVPFKGNTTMETFDKHLSEAIPKVLDYASDIPSPLAELIEKMLEKDPAKRIQSMILVSAVVDEIQYDNNEEDQSIEKTPNEEQKNIEILESRYQTKFNFAIPVAVLIVTIVIATFMLTNLDNSTPKNKITTKKKIFLEEPDPLEQKLDLRGGVVEHILRSRSKDWLKCDGNIFVDNDVIQEVAPEFKNMRYVNLGKTNITDQSLFYLRDKPLIKLIIPDTNITDTGVEYVAQMSTLIELDLSGTKVTDQGIGYLKDLKNLQTIYLRGCNKVSQEAVEKLNKSIPGLNVIRHRAFNMPDEINLR